MSQKSEHSEHQDELDGHEEKSQDAQSPASKWQKLADEEQAEVEQAQGQEKSSMSERSRESLENEIVDLRAKVADSKELVLRTQAEMQNLRRRLERDMDNAYKYANEKLVSELLPILDSLSRGRDALPEGDSAREGIELTSTLLKDVLAKHGVEVIQPSAGEAFNPQRHEAMSLLESPEMESNCIIDVLQPGCELNGRVLRAAMVVVSK